MVQRKHTEVLCVHLLPSMSPGFISIYNNSIRGSHELLVVEGDQQKGMERTVGWGSWVGSLQRSTWLGGKKPPSCTEFFIPTVLEQRWVLLGGTKDLSVVISNSSSANSQLFVWLWKLPSQACFSMHLLIPSKLLIHEPFQVTWELEALQTPSAMWQVLQLDCSAWEAWQGLQTSLERLEVQWVRLLDFCSVSGYQI